MNALLLSAVLFTFASTASGTGILGNNDANSLCNYNGLPECKCDPYHHGVHCQMETDPCDEPVYFADVDYNDFPETIHHSAVNVRDICLLSIDSDGKSRSTGCAQVNGVKGVAQCICRPGFSGFFCQNGASSEPEQPRPDILPGSH